MSDDLPLEILKTLNFEQFRNLICVDTNHCDKYIRRQTVSEKDVILTAYLPYEYVRGWSSARSSKFRVVIFKFLMHLSMHEVALK